MNRLVERGSSTRGAIVESAVRLFAQRGYEATSIEAVLEDTQVSRGSLYHHFASKQELFAAVLERVEERVAAATVGAARRETDALAGLRAGCVAWLRLARDPEVRQIVLVDAPSVVGWQRWREIDERHAFGILKLGIEAIPGAHRNPAVAPEMLAHFVLAALVELAMLIARAERPRAATRDAIAALDALLDSLLGGPGPEPGAATGAGGSGAPAPR